jgi:hypothetical protein
MTAYAQQRPVIHSYYSGYEFSLEHLVEVKRLVAEVDQERKTTTKPMAAAEPEVELLALGAKAG